MKKVFKALLYFFLAWTPYIDHYIWIGGREYNGTWQWSGKLRRDIVVEDWYPQCPNNNGGAQECLGLFAMNQRLQWDDGTCTSAQYFMCEKV